MDDSNKFKGLEKYTVGDMFSNRKLEKMMKINPKFFEDLNKSMKSLQKHQAEKSAQPFKTNYFLEELLHSQTPIWVNITTLAIATITLLLLIYQIFFIK